MGQARLRGDKAKRKELAILKIGEEHKRKYLECKVLEDAKSPEQKARERADLVESARRRMERLVCYVNFKKEIAWTRVYT